MRPAAPLLAVLLSGVLAAPSLLSAPARRAAEPPVRNVVLVIGDGMGLAHVTAGRVVNGGALALEAFPVVGLSKTWSADRLVTDSAASGTAMACGVKTKNGAIGVDAEGRRVPSVLELARDRGMRTGLVATSSITHATPAAFVAHQLSRKQEEEIAADLVTSGVTLFVGGGRRFFSGRTDGRDLLAELGRAGYEVVDDPAALGTAKGARLGGLVADLHLPAVTEGRGSYLVDAVSAAVSRLAGPKGFFLMVEGSQVDWGAHDGDGPRAAAEVVDLDRAVARLVDFARKDGRTLVVVTADHETGGLGLTGGSLETRSVEFAFGTKGHTATMVPVFAYGPGSAAFAGTYENTGIFERIRKALGL